MNKKIINILLWAVVLPASFLGAFIVYFIYRFFLLWILGDGWVFLIFGNFFSDLFLGVFIVGIGSHIIPNKKRIVSILLILFIIILFTFALFTNLSRPLMNNTWVTISGLLTISGAIATTIFLWNEKQLY